MSECAYKNELHWHVTPCKHGQWPQMFCKNCNGVYAESVREDIKLESENNASRKLATPSTESIDNLLNTFATYFPWEPEKLKKSHYEQAMEEANSSLLDLIKQTQIDLLNDLKTKKVKGANLIEIKWIDEALKRLKEGIQCG